MPRRPNFLFFITDQQRADWLGCYGHPVLRTPHIDALAARGTRFDNCYVAAPVCMPNRASLMTGRYPSVHGLRCNGARLPLHANTFVDVLAAAGYHTASIGKSHLQPFLDTPPLRSPVTGDRLILEAWQPQRGDYGNEEPGRYSGSEHQPVATPYYGFQHVDMVTDHGDRCGGHYQQWFRATAPDWQALHDPANELPHDYSAPQAYRTPIPESLYPTTWVADRAVDYLDSRSGDDTPFFAFVSFPDPHHPFNPPGAYWDQYDPADFPVDLPFEAHRNPTPPMRWLDDAYRQGGKPVTAQTATRVSDRHVSEVRALTAGMISCIDDQVGRVMAALEAVGHADNTVVCFNADHGDYLGDFNLILKGLLPLRSVNRVPFIWSDPADPTPRQTAAMASTVDIGATVLDRAGLTPYYGIQGLSQLSVARGGDAVRTDTLVEFNDGAAKFGFESPARVRSLITPDWRLSLYRDQDWGELYDLQNDPRETHNLWDSVSHAGTRAELTLTLAHRLTAQMDECPLPERLA
ncbi:MAG: sulfatase-like hydrolase/transferase [Pseudomonadota bacterium]